MIPQNKGDIVDWQYEPMAFEEFRQRQAELLARGFRVVMDKITEDYPCPTCGSTARVYIETALFKGVREFESFTVDVCVCCWSVLEGIPVYESR